VTILVGILCTDGVVIGTDTVATEADPDGDYTAEQPALKIDVVRDKIIVATTGEVGLGQRFVAHVDHLAPRFAEKTPLEAAALLTAEVYGDFRATGAFTEVVEESPDGKRKAIGTRFGVGALVAFAYRNQPQLVEFASGSLQPEVKGAHISPFASMGSGKRFADPFLGFVRRAFSPDGTPKLATATFLTMLTLDHVIDVCAGGGIGGAPRLATVRDLGDGVWRVHELTDEELDEHREMVQSAYAHIAGFETAFLAGGKAKVPLV